MNFLLEIGAEEIPDWMIEPALKQLGEDFTKLLAANNLAGSLKAVDASPRRLTLWAEGLPAGQSDGEDLVTGPPKSAGPGAANGFAKKQGVTLDVLETLTTDKGEYFAYRKKMVGRTTSVILAEALPDLILKLYFPKTMYWTGKGGPRFIRPIRWIVALLGDDVVKFEIAGVTSGNVTYGHRRLSKGPIPVTYENYEQSLRENHVLVRATERRKRILDGIAKLGANVKTDEKLLHVLTYITEWPSPIIGNFDESYLQLPKEVLVMVMRHHQKNFSVEKADGGLSNQFVAVMNIDNDNEGIVQRGNERVIRARFNDAKFFWDVDQQRKLADRVEDLGKVTFQAKLGTYLEKTNRMVDLARKLGGEDAARAAYLAKADLTTELVKEFTDLQGIVGGLYAREQGEGEAVALAVYEHYKPLSMEDSIPSTPGGQAVGLADKLDTLSKCFSVGMKPTGSKDPFALRRAMQGVVKILIEGELVVGSKLKKFLVSNNLEPFFKERLLYYLHEIKGFPLEEVSRFTYDQQECWYDPKDLVRRLSATTSKWDDELLDVRTAFKRVKNMCDHALDQGKIPVAPAGAPPFDATLLIVGVETQLNEAFLSYGKEFDEAIKMQNYDSVLAILKRMSRPINEYLDGVLVMHKDDTILLNRISLLRNIQGKFESFGRLS